jgi:eukaryotic-like serine/threonine-protein kinase
MTQAGMILGTAAYMSPEQARGKPIDRRADIWDFGVILFELLTGKTLFGGGETISDSLAAVLTREPDYNALPKDTPTRLRRLIERCLRKDPKLRLRDIGEARVLLDEPEPEVARPDTAARSWVPWAAAGVLSLALVLSWILWERPKLADPGLGAVRFLMPLPQNAGLPSGSAATQWVPSPDGRNLAIVSADPASPAKGNVLWVRPLSATSAHLVDKTEGASFPFWSPDGQSIGFFTEDQIRRVAVSGGSVQTICDYPKGSRPGTPGDGATWGKDGTILFGAPERPLMRVPAVGGIPSPVTTLDKDERSHMWPQLLPAGRHFLYLARSADPARHAIYVQELGSSKRIRVVETPTRAVWSPPGYLLFVRESTLFAQRMDPKTFRLEGEALTVADEVVANATNGRSTFATSENGVLVYRTGVRRGAKQLTWRDRNGKVLSAAGKPGEFRTLSLSPDEKSVALIIGSSPQDVDVWIMNLASGVLTPMTHGFKVYSSVPIWSPDSQRLVVSAALRETREITVASGKATQVSTGEFQIEDWSPDGRFLIGRNPDVASGLSLLSIAEGYKPGDSRRALVHRIRSDSPLTENIWPTSRTNREMRRCLSPHSLPSRSKDGYPPAAETTQCGRRGAGNFSTGQPVEL